MESWRNELYNSLSHSTEGSTWKDHKYIAIVDGRYIYPEDVQNGQNSTASAAPATTTTTQTSTVTPPTSPKKVKKQKDKSGNAIDVTDKGSVKTYKDLPKDPNIGDMYLLEDTKRYCYWNGEIWTPIDESAAEAAGATPIGEGVGSGGGSGSRGGKKEDAVNGISQDTIDRARSAVKGMTISKKKTVKLNPDTGVSSLSGSRQVQTGKNSAKGSLKNLASKAISTIKNTKAYKTGANLINKIKNLGKKATPIKLNTSSKGVRR